MEDKKYNIAIVGATGRVGIEILEILEERNFPVNEIYPLASEKSEGQRVEYKDKKLVVKALKDFEFDGVDIAFFSAGSDISKEYAPKAAQAGAVVIDNTSYFRDDPMVPLVIPEVNGGEIHSYSNKGIIANPNCTTIQMLMALAPLHQEVPIKRIVASTYQSVSGSGNKGLEELFEQTKGVYSQQPAHKTQNAYTKQIAFNCIPHIDTFLENGITKEEYKMWFETKKILSPDIEVSATCVRVPVFISHAVTLNVQFEGEISEETIKEKLMASPGVSVIDFRQDEGYVTQVECAGEDKVYVSRIREDITQENTVNMWVVGDNLRKGAALNAVQIAEDLTKIV